jgi:hypothetical protein
MRWAKHSFVSSSNLRTITMNMNQNKILFIIYIICISNRAISNPARPVTLLLHIYMFVAFHFLFFSFRCHISIKNIFKYNMQVMMRNEEKKKSKYLKIRAASTIYFFERSYHCDYYTQLNTLIAL